MTYVFHVGCTVIMNKKFNITALLDVTTLQNGINLLTYSETSINFYRTDVTYQETVNFIVTAVRNKI
jgi:hypothetical protein